MIGTLLDFVAKDLNSFICQQLGLPDSDQKLILSPIVNPDGSTAITQKNILLLDLVNIKKDGLINNNFPPVNAAGTNYLQKRPPLYLNLNILIAAHFEKDQFKEGLNILSMVLGKFQGKPLWNRENTPTLPPKVDKLIFEMFSLDFHEQSHLWGYLGAKYMPSVLYKLRMAIIDEELVTGEIPPVTEIIINASPEGTAIEEKLENNNLTETPTDDNTDTLIIYCEKPPLLEDED
ncbi:MAG: DUF4255 domain-containing protein [Saprospiraceae bacterium]